MFKFKTDPRYELRGGRWHLTLPPKQIPAGGIADGLHERTKKAFAGVERHADVIAAIADPNVDPKAASRLLQYNDDAAGRIVNLRRQYGDQIDPQAYLDGHQRLQAFLPQLAQHVLDGAHGHHPAVRQALANVRVEHLGATHDNASFWRTHGAGPADGKHALQFGGWTVMGHTTGAKASDPGSDFYGAPHLLSPELLGLHEMAHLLDFGLGTAHHPDARHPDPALSRKGQLPGLKMVQGYHFAHLHDALGQHAQDGGLPVLPQPFTRLHYPTNGGSKPGELPQTAQMTAPHGSFEHGLAIERRSRISEWPSVMSELGVADPSALMALDSVLGRHPDGRTSAELVDGFWGFPLVTRPDAKRARVGADVLRGTLEKGGAQRAFQPVSEVGFLMHPDPRK